MPSGAPSVPSAGASLPLPPDEASLPSLPSDGSPPPGVESPLLAVGSLAVEPSPDGSLPSDESVPSVESVPVPSDGSVPSVALSSEGSVLEPLR